MLSLVQSAHILELLHSTFAIKSFRISISTDTFWLCLLDLFDVKFDLATEYFIQ